MTSCWVLRLSTSAHWICKNTLARVRSNLSSCWETRAFKSSLCASFSAGLTPSRAGHLGDPALYGQWSRETT